MPASIIFAGGGSGGHLSPAIAVAEELIALVPETSVVFATSTRDVDQAVFGSISDAARLVSRSEQFDVPAGRELWRTPWSSWPKAWRGMTQAHTLIRDVAPQVVIGTGGFASLPVLSAAAALDVTILLLEQNVIPGRATTTFAKLADAICLSHEPARSWFATGIATPVTGNPVRRSFSEMACQTASHPTNAHRRTLLVTGGSQGAAQLNSALIELARSNPAALTGWHVIHQTGASDVTRVREAYDRAAISSEVSAFISDMATVLRHCDVAISRAGATTLAELACAGVPAILVPYPGSVRDHQLANARHFASAGAAWLIEQAPTPAATTAGLLPVLNAMTPQTIAVAGQAMRSLACPTAARTVAEMIALRL